MSLSSMVVQSVKKTTTKKYIYPHTGRSILHVSTADRTQKLSRVLIH